MRCFRECPIHPEALIEDNCMQHIIIVRYLLLHLYECGLIFMYV